MRHGDLVSVRWPTGPRSVRCVALRVTAADIRRGAQVRKPGSYLFRGYWYGADPWSVLSYGKIEGQVGRVQGRVRTDRQVRRLGV